MGSKPTIKTYAKGDLIQYSAQVLSTWDKRRAFLLPPEKEGYNRRGILRVPMPVLLRGIVLGYSHLNLGYGIRAQWDDDPSTYINHSRVVVLMVAPFDDHTRYRDPVRVLEQDAILFKLPLLNLRGY